MRPHVEIIDERDYLWHPAELVRAEGEAVQRNLAYDEEDGSASTKVRFASDWSRPAGIHHADTEWYVLSGQVQVGDDVLRPGGYWHAPAGVLTPALRATEGTEVLLFREYGDWGFDPAEGNRADVRADQKLTVMNTEAMSWEPVETGSPMRFDLGGTPVEGLHIKLLHRDEVTGFYTRLIMAEPGWREHPLAHHPCYEEAYCLEGGFEYNYGSMWPGTYFFRPPLLRHGDFTTAMENGCTWLLRSDSDLVDWYTEEASVQMHGKALNYGPEYPGTVGPRLLQPVRSRSVGAWADPTYQ